MAITDFIFGRPSAVLAEKGEKYLRDATEIRLGANRPVIIRKARDGRVFDEFLTKDGEKIITSKRDLQASIEAICEYSLFAYGESLKNGYITTADGCRVGVCGRAVVEDGRVKTIKNVSSLSFRVPRQIIGCADKLFTFCTDKPPHSIKSVLIVSPPGKGKTTLLRDLARLASNAGFFVSIADERGEIAACGADGLPCYDLGPRTDVLDGCPKRDGIGILLRSMSPNVIAVDELGGPDDAQAVSDALNAGVAVFCTVHGADIQDVSNRAGTGALIAQRAFDVYAVMSRTQTGVIQQILDKGFGLLC